MSTIYKDLDTNIHMLYSVYVQLRKECDRDG